MQRATTHPGKVLLEEFMKPLGLGVKALADALKMRELRLEHILSARQGVSIDAALRLARYFGTKPETWLHLQLKYDLALAKHTTRQRIRWEVQPRVPQPGPRGTRRAELSSPTHAQPRKPKHELLTVADNNSLTRNVDAHRLVRLPAGTIAKV